MMEEIHLSEEKADVLLNISSMLMNSGANTNRIVIILEKFAELLNVDAQTFINHKAFIISLKDNNTGERTTQIKRLPHKSIDFEIISALSKTGLKAEKEKWSFEKIKDEVNNIQHLKKFNRIIILISVSLAGAGFCNIFNGDYLSMAVTFFATFIGLFVRQETHKKGFNAYLCAFLAAFTAGLFAAASLHFFPTINPNIAIATSVLFLIPGVPLINAFTDMIDGYILTGFSRLLNGLMYVFSIALALFFIMYIFGIQNL